MSVVAILPGTSEFEEEARDAAQWFPRVFRYDLAAILSGVGRDDEKLWEEQDSHRVTVRLSDSVTSSLTVRAVHRGYLTSAAEYRTLYQWLLDRHRVMLLTRPDAYERCSYYPLQHDFIRAFAPRALWVPLPVPEGRGERENQSDRVTTGTHQRSSTEKDAEREPAQQFSEELVADLCRPACEQIVRERHEWEGNPKDTFPLWRFVVLKDYVKSEKSSDHDVARFLHAPADSVDELVQRAGELASKRAAKKRLYRGVVFKEGVPLQLYPSDCRQGGVSARGSMTEVKPVANEWRLWFTCAELLSNCGTELCSSSDNAAGRGRGNDGGDGGGSAAGAAEQKEDTSGGEQEGGLDAERTESSDAEREGVRLLCAAPNSLQAPARVDAVPAALLRFCREEVAARVGSPYVTVDVAETQDELLGSERGGGESGEEACSRWIVLEVGDGGASGPAPGQDMREHWRQLWHSFKAA